MKNVRSFLRFHTLRLLERIFRPDALYQLLLPVASLRAALKKCPATVPLPAVIGPGPVIPVTRQSRRSYYLNNTLGAFPDRLASPAWFGRCSFSGLEALQEVRRRRQPAVIVVGHFGAVYLLRLWLQAAGIPAATLVTGTATQRDHLNRLKDGVALFPEIPCVFYPDQLRAVKKFLADGNMLIIAMDNPSGRQVEIPVDRTTRFQMATGAARLAARHGARLFPGNIIDEGRWRFRVVLGRPVPEEFLAGAPDLPAVAGHVLGEMLPVFRAHPEQCTPMIFDSFRMAPEGER